MDIVSWPRERLWASTTGTSTTLCSGDLPLGSALPLARPSLTQAVPVASIWHVGAQAAPNLFSEDWLQDWKVLGAEQDAAGKGAQVRRARGPQHTTVQATASVALHTQKHLRLPPAAQPPVDAVAAREAM